MLKNYLKTSLRFLSKNKTYSFINIFGLALGTLCCIYIILYVTDQYSYDKHQPQAKGYLPDHYLPGSGGRQTQQWHFFAAHRAHDEKRFWGSGSIHARGIHPGRQ